MGSLHLKKCCSHVLWRAWSSLVVSVCLGQGEKMLRAYVQHHRLSCGLRDYCVAGGKAVSSLVFIFCLDIWKYCCLFPSTTSQRSVLSGCFLLDPCYLLVKVWKWAKFEVLLPRLLENQVQMVRQPPRAMMVFYAADRGHVDVHGLWSH